MFIVIMPDYQYFCTAYNIIVIVVYLYVLKRNASYISVVI